MFKKFIQGIVFGSGLAIAFAAIVTIWLTWILPNLVVEMQREHSGPASGSELAAPPALSKRPKFLGSMGTYDGDFSHNSNAMLAAGDGVITGLIRSNGRPVEGMRLRLALNGSVMSQWGITDADGRYRIPVPYGEYRVDGYELDMQSANEKLQGKIDHPMKAHGGATLQVGPDKDGEGLNLDYVDPIIKQGPTNEVSLKDEIIARWQAYPGAASYVVQVFENDSLHSFAGENPVFPWSRQPTVTESMINLTGEGVQFKSGHYYTLQIRARDASGHFISETARQHAEKDFKVVE